jgi:phosphoesterase RecJ-like protein
MTWPELNALLRKHQSFLISSHLSLDGDSVGSQLAFAWYLQSLGKRVAIFDLDPVPRKLQFLQGVSSFTSQKPAEQFDVLAILDCSNPDRLGWEGISAIAPVSLNIDHHRDNTRFANHNIVGDRSAATAELLYDFFSHMEIKYPPAVAEALYAAVLTDTGGFRFSNTSTHIFQIAADLSRQGVNCSRIYQQIYDSHSQAGMMLWSRIWSSLQFHLNGKVCSIDLPLDVIDQLGASRSDCEGMADFTIMADGVEIGMFIKYQGEQTHFSLRSRGRIDVGKIAHSVSGGGGHSSAAGCTIHLPFAQAKEKMLALIARELG